MRKLLLIIFFSSTVLAQDNLLSLNLEEAIDKIKTNSRRYAKRQLTWFKSNKKVNWYSYDYDLKVILNMIKSIQQST